MEGFTRFAVFVVPEGMLFRLGSDWLGWDMVAGETVMHPLVEGLPAPVQELTATPRRYGFHGTVKPPFRLAEGRDPEGLRAAFEAMAAKMGPVACPGLVVRSMGGFVALVPSGPAPVLEGLAEFVVEELDDWRAPPGEAELERRRASGLTERQEANLTRWGYPYVMDEFRFHITLTGRLDDADAVGAATALQAHFEKELFSSYGITSLCLVGEDADGRFHLIDRRRLGA